jgi:hypothetical protein
MSPPLLADEGRIPVWEPVTIDAPGHYVLTRDISTTGAQAIAILSDGVTLDLGGRTISLDPATMYGIRVDLTAFASGQKGIVIRNGRIVGGQIGIYVPSIVPSLWIEGIEVYGTSSDGIHISLDDPDKGIIGDVPVIVIGKSFIHDIGGDGLMLADPRPDPLCSLTIDGNIFVEIDKDGIEADGCTDVVIKNNEIAEFGQLDAPAAGIRLVGGGAADAPVVTSNVISSGGTEAAGFVADSFSSTVGFVFENNGVSDNGDCGIVVNGGRGRIKGNLLVNNGEDGVRVSGGFGIFIDDNYVSANLGYGIYFAATNEHAYRDNFLRGNRLGALGGEANTDAGGNIQ